MKISIEYNSDTSERMLYNQMFVIDLCEEDEFCKQFIELDRLGLGSTLTLL